MVICVYGAGSVGCYVGARLAAAGAQVVFVGRERLASQIREHGLTATDWRGTELRVPRVAYETGPEAAAEADLVLVTVKSGATATAADELARRLGPTAAVVSLQNGLYNADVLRERLPGRTVLAGVIGCNVVARGQGRFHAATAGDIEVERHPVLDQWREVFAAAGIPLVPHDGMSGVQAAKLLLNLNNAINALAGLPLRAELSQRAFRRCLAAAQREALAVFAAAGLRPSKLTPLPPGWMPALLESPDAVFKRAASRMLAIDPTARSSMWDDLEAGRASEVDQLNGAVVEMARRHGIAAPVNERLVELVRAAEAGGRRDWSGARLLAALTGRD